MYAGTICGCWLAGAAVFVAVNGVSGAQNGARAGTIAYPAEYREWGHVKSTLIGPGSQSFESNGGIHHYYANAKAMEGFRSGEFPDGSVLIDDLLAVREVSPGVTSESGRRRLAVMVKDGDRFTTTGGWGFEVFKGDSQNGSLSAEGRTACFTCHQKRPELVFSEYRR